MKNNIIPFIIGIVVAIVVLSSIVWFATRGENPQSAPAQKVISSGDLQKIKDNSTGLKNYGNLPVTVNPSDFGRDNPFDSY